MQLSHAFHAAATVTPPSSRSDSPMHGAPGRRARTRSYLLQGYAARRRPTRFRVR